MATVLPFDGHTPDIHPTAWVAPTATIVGNVRIGARASVFYGAVLRGDMDAIVLGEGSNIQDNCVVHTDTGVPATIGAGARSRAFSAAYPHPATLRRDSPWTLQPVPAPGGVPTQLPRSHG